MKLTFVRHGVTEWNTLGRWQGHSDNPLSEAGEHQARLLARRLKGQSFDLVYSSDLVRARRTAELALPGVSVLVDERLREVHFGEFDGRTFDQIRLHPLFATWAERPFEVPTPSGESLSEVVTRGLAWASTLPDGANVVTFTHSLFIRSLVCHLIDIPFRSSPHRIFPVPLSTPHTSLTVVRRAENDWTLERLGDDSHLEHWTSSDASQQTSQHS
ncbi:histidine phosphatase family protein [Deinococcus yavapaiensis]|uniref:Alpha-ribazole phosphatase/probable phosphoglycerate mutase n=1 Tax=Deinococcus yavapaiensis KR-236 TaxID=694435 RepID=A0A318SK37_9DEIO|nr:histidine phosphatase family protein [Deinococcus yavapaiensis]PYE52918.1 alpha-ribazole phosphatase/probable phosphoglycerate mutase [Deinococcus yavapaiensis KR-236]